MEPFRFTWQENQYWGSCEPCTASVFSTQVRSEEVAWKIGMRQAVEEAVGKGMPLDEFTGLPAFQYWCNKQESRPKAGLKFAQLTAAEKLLQWVQTLKSSLPDFVFAVREFKPVPRQDKLYLLGFARYKEAGARWERHRLVKGVLRKEGTSYVWLGWAP